MLAPRITDTSPPALGAVKPLTVPAVVERTLSNGLRLLIVEHHELPIVDFALIVKSGAEADPIGKDGLATMMASMLDEGTATRNSLQIAEQIANLGISLGTSSGWDALRVSLHTPTAQLDNALALMADITLRPRFADKELERLRQERLTGLLQLKDRGPAIADLAYNHILYGAEHPYGRPPAGNERSTRRSSPARICAHSTTRISGRTTRADRRRRCAAGRHTAAGSSGCSATWQRGTVPPTRSRHLPTRPRQPFT